MSQESQKPEGPDILETSSKREIDPAFAMKMVGRMRAGFTADGSVHSALKRSPPSPSRMTALRKEKKRSEYSPGSTGLILC